MFPDFEWLDFKSPLCSDQKNRLNHRREKSSTVGIFSVIRMNKDSPIVKWSVVRTMILILNLVEIMI